MAELVKDLLNERYFYELSVAIKCVIYDFDELLFFSQIFDNEWENKGIKQRMRHVSTVFKNFLPADTKEAIAKIVELTNHLKKEYPPDSVTQIARKQSFRVTTTRVLHTGLHQVSIIINGNETQKYDFELIE